MLAIHTTASEWTKITAMAFKFTRFQSD